MSGITFYEDCLIGASNSLLRFWCAHPNSILQGADVLFILLLVISFVVGKKRGWRWGSILFVVGTGIVVLARVLVQTGIISTIWG